VEGKRAAYGVVRKTTSDEGKEKEGGDFTITGDGTPMCLRGDSMIHAGMALHKRRVKKRLRRGCCLEQVTGEGNYEFSAGTQEKGKVSDVGGKNTANGTEPVRNREAKAC